jgi:hypothetical protein
MGYTHVIYSDATTAEAASILKSCGYLESNQGAMFTSPSSSLKIYVVWGRSQYYPDLLARLSFTPRIQIHVKCRERTAELTETALAIANGLRDNAPGTQARAFDAALLQEIAP